MSIKLAILGGTALASFVAGAFIAHQFSEADKVKELQAALQLQTEKYEARDAKFAADAKRDKDLSLRNAILAQELESANDALSQAIRNPKIKFVTREVPTDAKPCPDTRRNAQYVVCVNAAYSGDPAAIAACAAGGSDAAVLSEHVPTP